MTPSTKKLVILSLAGGFGRIVRDLIKDPEKRKAYYADLTQDEIDLILWNCDAIEQAGQIAMDRMTAYIKKDNSALRLAERKIIEAAGGFGLVDMLRMLSFLCLGLDELWHYCNEKETIARVKDAALNFLTVWDSNLTDEATHEAALKDYERWIAA